MPVPTNESNRSNEYDLVIVGFGAAALAFACALEEHPKQPLQTKRVIFLEKQAQFGWHDGMLLPHSMMQISFIKDLVTLRNPRSYFSFVNFLHQTSPERLMRFSNVGSFEPPRLEFKQYLAWAASHFDKYVRYNTDICSILPEPGRASQRILITSSNGETFTTANLLIASGSAPCIPPMYKELPPTRMSHSSTIIKSAPKLLESAGTGRNGVAVIGAGQSAAEIFCFFDEKLEAEIPVYLIGSVPAIIAADDTPFVNEFYFPADNSKWFDMDSETKRKLLERAKPTNYGVVNGRTLEKIYNRLYEKDYIPELAAKRDIMMSRKIQACSINDKKISLSVQHQLTHIKEELTVDAVVLATGYQNVLLERELAQIKEQFVIKDDRLQLSRNYQALKKSPTTKYNIWIIGYDENQHGIGERLLSWAATRSGRIAEEIFPNLS